VGEDNYFPGGHQKLPRHAFYPTQTCATLRAVNPTRSKFVEGKTQGTRLGPAQAAATAARRVAARERDLRIKDDLQERAALVAPYLTKRFGIEFRGRILEIGAGAGWLSAELSKLPKVVEVVATDVSAKRLREEAPRVFGRVGAIEHKITRMAADIHDLHFPSNHFDFVVCAAVLNRTVNIAEALREAKRVLKPGGFFVAVREPVESKLRVESKRATEERARTGRRLYTLDEYQRFFAAAGLSVECKPVHMSSGLKFFFTQFFNGLTHSRYALIARKPTQSAPKSASPGGKPRLMRK
jgi:ubiquinone/menaquinone biosynthesis C-methylase UbiE